MTGPSINWWFNKPSWMKL